MAFRPAWIASLGGRPHFIRAGPAYAARLVAQGLAGGRALARYLMAVMTGAETLTPVQAVAIRAAFGCRVVSHYPTWEVPHMAQSCPDNPALLHVNSERVVLRVVGDDGCDVRPGKRGRVVVTALANDVMPLINGDLGDWAIRGTPCPCGRGFPTLAAIEGRSGEMIETPEGRAITPAMLTNQLALQCEVVGFILECQAEQTGPDAVTLRVVPAPGFTTGMMEALREGLGRLVGPDLAVVGGDRRSDLRGAVGQASDHQDPPAARPLSPTGPAPAGPRCRARTGGRPSLRAVPRGPRSAGAWRANPPATPRGR